MNIVLDANVIVVKDWFLKSPKIELLKKFLNLTDSKLIIPKIISCEVLNKYKELISKKKFEIDEINILLEPSKQLYLNIEEIFLNYKSALGERFITLKVEEPDYPNITHEDIIARDLARRRPFQESGKGYRDTLFWETILRKIVNSDTKTYLISENYKDFGYRDKSTLHDDLKEDLLKIGLSSDSVILYKNLSDFINEQVKPLLDPIEKAKEELEKGVYAGFDIYEWFDKNREAIGNSIQQSMDLIRYILKGLEDISVSYVEDPEEIKINNAYELSINQIYIDIFIKVEVVLDAFIFKADFYCGVGEEYNLDVMDYDWNDHYIYAQTTTKLPINLAINFNIKNRIVDDFEVTIEEIFGFCPYCSAPIMSDAAENCGECGKAFF
ncbi:MAG: PIN domain-containing protein [Candidatus Humimicrobiaceae bacterium]